MTPNRSVSAARRKWPFLTERKRQHNSEFSSYCCGSAGLHFKRTAAVCSTRESSTNLPGSFCPLLLRFSRHRCGCALRSQYSTFKCGACSDLARRTRIYFGLEMSEILVRRRSRRPQYCRNGDVVRHGIKVSTGDTIGRISSSFARLSREDCRVPQVKLKYDCEEAFAEDAEHVRLCQDASLMG